MPKAFALDPRYFQLIFQFLFLSYGIFFLSWDVNRLHYIICIAGCIFFHYLLESRRQKQWLPIFGKRGFASWGLSALISAMSLCLLLKVNHWYISLIAAFFTVASKYIFRFRQKHIFNPSAFGIVAAILLTNDAWLSSGQWGSNAVVFFAAITFGTIVVTSVQKLDASLGFLLTFIGLLYWRQVYVLGWPADYFIHSISSGGLLLFTFFMISDPKTSPDHPAARIIWSVLIASISFYLTAFKWIYNAPVWVLVCAAPLVPVLNMIFKARPFQWSSTVFRFNILSNPKKLFMKSITKKISAMLVLIAMISHEAMAFCGFYVSKADGTLKNKTSQVIIVHDGNRNVITMYNDFKGNTKDFAMVVPVPVVLKKNDIKVVDQHIFQLLNEYSQPRLVEYYDQNPCERYEYEKRADSAPAASLDDVTVQGYGRRKSLGVKVEAKYLVGEYDILILSAKESSGLKTWLIENGYKIPDGAEEVLEPYIKSDLKFFVVKVNEEEKKKLPGGFLRPIQISFNSPKFMLPIRLGMANAEGDQDLIVYAFTKNGRIECANYRTVALPTGKNIPLFVQNNFSNFYSNLFQHQWEKEGRSVAMLEYAWDVSPGNYVKCDPCVATAPSTQDLVQAGVWWVTRNWDDYSDVYDDDTYSNHVFFTRMHVRYNRQAFPQDLMFQVTSNTENFQARYIITHPASGDFNCDAGRKYLRDLKERRKGEIEMLSYLTGKGYDDWDVVLNTDEEKYIPVEDSYDIAASETKSVKKRDNTILFATLGVVCLVSWVGFGQRRKQ